MRWLLLIYILSNDAQPVPIYSGHIEFNSEIGCLLVAEKMAHRYFTVECIKVIE